MKEDLPAATVSFLENPPGRKHAGRKAKRRPPQGWPSWKAYMAHIRGKKKGGHTARKRTNPRGTAHRARPRKSGSRSRELLVIPLKPRRRNPVGARHARGFIMNQVHSAIRVTMGAGAAITGELGARGGRALVTKAAPGSLVASAWEVGIGLVGGELLRMVSPAWGEFFAVGAVMAPIRSALQAAKIPFVSSTLGDDGFLVGPGTGVMLISAHPGDYQDAVAGGSRRELPGAVADYVTGPAPGATLNDYVTGPSGQLQDYVTGPQL